MQATNSAKLKFVLGSVRKSWFFRVREIYKVYGNVHTHTHICTDSKVIVLLVGVFLRSFLPSISKCWQSPHKQGCLLFCGVTRAGTEDVTSYLRVWRVFMPDLTTTLCLVFFLIICHSPTSPHHTLHGCSSYKVIQPSLTFSQDNLLMAVKDIFSIWWKVVWYELDI